MGKFRNNALEKRRAKRKKKAGRSMPTGDQAIQNALAKGFITEQQVGEYYEMKKKKEAAEQKIKKALKFKRPARIFTGLNTNSM
jgi:hypothetical protein